MFLLYIAFRSIGRPKNQHTTITIQVSASPKLAAYLDDLHAEEGYGNSRAAVAKALIWQSLHDLIGKGIIDRRKGPVDDGDS